MSDKASRDFQRANPRAAVAIEEIVDPTVLGEAFGVLEQDLVALESGRFRARRVTVKLGPSVLVFIAVKHRVRSRTRLHPELMSFVALGPKSSGTIDGRRLRRDALLVAPPGVEAELVVDPGYESILILARPGDLPGGLRDTGFKPPARPDAVDLWHVGAQHAANLFAVGLRIANTAERYPERFEENPAARQQAHMELMLELIYTLASGSVRRVVARTDDSTRQRYSEITKVAQDYATAKSGDQFHVADLCDVTGVSQRTLRTAFQETLGMSPMAYLLRRRLHVVRACLQQASPRRTRVAAVALDWGFWHLGDFSRAYKRGFGEVPSETLRRPPVESAF